MKKKKNKLSDKTPSLIDDWKKLIKNPIPLKEFQKKYWLCAIPNEMFTDLILLLHLHRKELIKLKK